VPRHLPLPLKIKIIVDNSKTFRFGRIYFVKLPLLKAMA
jgi:hypothetical protein